MNAFATRTKRQQAKEVFDAFLEAAERLDYAHIIDVDYPATNDMLGMIDTIQSTILERRGDLY